MSRPVASLLLAAAIAWPAGLRAQSSSSYEGVVTTRVRVRSGPSDKHYTTAILDRDSRVVVVRDEGNGWLAIEPPEGSFSWISGEFVREISATEGEVIGDNVHVRVGTAQSESLRDYPQIKLKRGDRVQIIDKKSSDQGPLSRIWYRIEPPPGEVRYISAQYVEPVSRRRLAPRTPAPRPGEPADDTAEPLERPTPRGLLTRQDEDGAEQDLGTHRRAAVPTSPQDALAAANTAYRDMLKLPLADRDIDHVLDLYERAAEVARSDADRAHVAQRLESLENQKATQSRYVEFERFYARSKQRDEALLSLPRKTTQQDPDEPAETGAHDPADEPDATGSSRTKYDASGLLRRSSAMIDGKPAYVLVSPQGGIRYYVTASPGTELKKYVDRLVAVRGPTSYRNEVRAPHITVREITVIELKR